MSDLIIYNTTIRQDADGRYCLNDLHKASGGDVNNKPGNWLRLDQPSKLIEEIINSTSHIREVKQIQPLKTVNGGSNPGTFACKELVYSYAMWISAKFQLEVIRVFDRYVTGQLVAKPKTALELAKEQVELLVKLDETEKQRDEAYAEIEVLKPDADAMNRLRASDGCLSITETAKLLKVKIKELTKRLQEIKWAYRKTEKSPLLGYKDAERSGFVSHRVAKGSHSGYVVNQLVITPLGLSRLSTLFNCDQLMIPM